MTFQRRRLIKSGQRLELRKTLRGLKRRRRRLRGGETWQVVGLKKAG